jgi:hypothetical protein
MPLRLTRSRTSWFLRSSTCGRGAARRGSRAARPSGRPAGCGRSRGPSRPLPAGEGARLAVEVLGESRIRAARASRIAGSGLARGWPLSALVGASSAATCAATSSSGLLAAGPEHWAEVDGIGAIRAHALQLRCCREQASRGSRQTGTPGDHPGAQHPAHGRSCSVLREGVPGGRCPAPALLRRRASCVRKDLATR